jgi:hypothetical protein
MTHRIARHALTLSALSALSALSPLSAQSGVLIGVSAPPGRLTDSASHPLRYQTLWIVRDAARPIRATIPDLLVPRADGWWRVGTVAICPTGGPPNEDVEVLWRARADSTPVVTELCHEVPRGDLPLLMHAEDSAAADSARRELVRCSWSEIQVKFLSPEHMAVGETTGQTEECEPRGGRWYQSYYTSRFHGDSSLALAELAGPRADSLGRIALSRVAREVAPEDLCTNILEGYQPGGLIDGGGAWYPSRDRGRWAPVLFEQVGTADCQLHATVEASLPRAFTSHDGLRPPWTALAKRIPALQDAFASPNGDLVIAKVRDSLLVYFADGRELSRRIAAVPLSAGEIVMIQWATGRHVARWNEEIATMMRRGLHAPRIVPPPKDP